MTRKEIYDKILQMLEIEQNYLLKRYEAGEIEYDVYVELSSSRTNEYREYITDLALTNDKILKDLINFWQVHKFFAKITKKGETYEFKNRKRPPR